METTDKAADPEDSPVLLNVGGTLFQTTWTTLKAVKDTRLSDLDATSKEWRPKTGDFFFDRDPAVFAFILGFYRTGELHLPNYVCATAIQKELQFWRVPETLVWDCCWKSLYKEGQLQRMKRELSEIFADHCPSYYEELQTRFRPGRLGRLRWLLWTTLEKPGYSTASKVWFSLYISLVVVTTTALFLQTLPALRSPIPVERLMESGIYNNVTGDCFFPMVTGWVPLASPKLILLMTTRPHDALVYVSLVCLVVFTIDLGLRLAVSQDRAVFCRQWENWLDAVVLVAEWLSCAFLHYSDYTVLGRVGEFSRLVAYFRFFRFYRLFLKSDELRVLRLCLHNCRKELLTLTVLTVAASAGFAILVYMAEIAEPRSLRDLPLALWWAVITLTAVGYGDVTPTSYPGRVISATCAVTGMLLVALPVAVIATNFGEYHALYREMLALVQRRSCRSPRKEKEVEEEEERAGKGVVVSPEPVFSLKAKMAALKKC